MIICITLENRVRTDNLTVRQSDILTVPHYSSIRNLNRLRCLNCLYIMYSKFPPSNCISFIQPSWLSDYRAFGLSSGRIQVNPGHIVFRLQIYDVLAVCVFAILYWLPTENPWSMAGTFRWHRGEGGPDKVNREF